MPFLKLEQLVEKLILWALFGLEMKFGEHIFLKRHSVAHSWTCCRNDKSTA